MDVRTPRFTQNLQLSTVLAGVITDSLNFRSSYARFLCMGRHAGKSQLLHNSLFFEARTLHYSQTGVMDMKTASKQKKNGFDSK